MIEARCTRCGEIFIPHSIDPPDMIHGQTEAETECGGIGVVEGEWVSPRQIAPESPIAVRLSRFLKQMEVHGKAVPGCTDEHCVWHHPKEDAIV
jgi:hypothetical protein